MTDISLKETDYHIRVSRRAKNVILKASAQHGLEVVIPLGFDPRGLPEILKAKEPWIEKQLQRFEGSPSLTVPKHIDLNAIDESWQVQYRPGSDGRLFLREVGPSALLILGDTGDPRGIALVLNRWLHLKARDHLVPWLRDVSGEVDIPFKKAGVRGQTTRWASCSQLGNISLNRSLLFLPKHLVRHVFLHELCHIERLDHSPTFWLLLEKLVPGCKGLEAEVRKANQYVPRWVQSK